MNTSIKKDWILLISYLYIFIPVLLFVFMWLKPYIGIVLGLLIIAGIYYSFKNETPLKKIEGIKERKPLLILGIGIIVLLILTSGIGASIKQYPDHLIRNTIFKVLIDKEWPVKLMTSNGHIRSMNYYIGFWLPAAFVGKFTSYKFALLFLQIWAIIGMLLIWYYMMERKQKFHLWYFVVFILFGGLDFLGTLLTGNIYEDIGNRYEWWSGYWNYPSMMTSLFWAFNQAIYAWLIYKIIMRQENNKSVVFVWSTALLSCTFPAIGLLPFAVYKAMDNVKDDSKGINRFINAVKQGLALTNVLGLVISIILVLYVRSNVAVHTGFNQSTALITSYTITQSFTYYKWTAKLLNYLWFVLLEFVVYYVVLYKDKHKDPLYWLSLIVLLMCPLIKIGNWVDFAMRASIPALLCLCELVIDSLQSYFENKQHYLFIALICLLTVASINCYDTLLGVLPSMSENAYEQTYHDIKMVSDKNFADLDNFFGRKESIFFKYFLK